MIEFKLIELQDFCLRWQEKADNYSEDNLADIFDKFSSLYIIFNRLYNTLEGILRDKDELNNIPGIRFKNAKNKELNDNVAATKLVAFYLEPKAVFILEILTNEINLYKTIIENNIFHFYSNSELLKDNRNKNDQNILKDLKSKIPEKRLFGILTVLYKLRCNLFHGTKGFFNEQKEVLLPAISSLKIINQSLIEKINSEQ